MGRWHRHWSHFIGLSIAVPAGVAIVNGLPVNGLPAQAAPSLTEQLHRAPSQTIRAQRDVADQFLLVGQAQINAGNHEQAIAALGEAANAYHYLGDFAGMGEAYEQLAKVYSGLGRYDEATQVVRSQLAIARSNNNYSDQILAYNNLGTLSLQAGDLATAQAAFTEGLAIAQSVESQSGIGLSLSNLGLIAVSNGQTNDARKYYEVAANYRARARDYAGQANTDSNLGDVYLATDRLREAVGAYRLSLSLAKEVNEPYIQLRALDGLISVYRKLNEPSELMAYLNSRIELTASTGDDWQRLLTLRTIGEINEENGNLREAYESYQRALQIATQLDRKQVQGELSNRVRRLSLQLAD
ncbi:MAG: tetratricopeptide repeat protein [Phormidesmis sp.]